MGRRKKRRDEIRITRFRSGKGVEVRLDIQSDLPRPSAPLSGEREEFDDAAFTSLPSAAFFSRERAYNRWDITTPDPFDSDADDLSIDVEMESNAESFYRDGAKSRFDHPYVTQELLYDHHGLFFTLDCDYEVAARNDYTTFKLLGDFSVRAQQMPRAAYRKLLDEIRNQPDDLVPLYETFGRSFTPLHTRRLVGVGKPKRMVGWAYNPYSMQYYRNEYVTYRKYKEIVEVPWAQALGLEQPSGTEDQPSRLTDGT